MEMEKKHLPGLIIQSSLDGVFHMEMEKRCLPGLIIQSSLEGVSKKAKVFFLFLLIKNINHDKNIHYIQLT